MEAPPAKPKLVEHKPLAPLCHKTRPAFGGVGSACWGGGSNAGAPELPEAGCCSIIGCVTSISKNFARSASGMVFKSLWM